MFDFLSFGTALAQTTAQAGQQPSLGEMLVMPAGFLLIMYFLIIRPQQKKSKEHQSLLGNLKAGDEVVTASGLIGRIKSVADAFVTVEIAANTNVKMTKASILSLSKPQEKAKA